MTDALPPYSVLISVYAKESPQYLRESLDSILAQTAGPEQIVVVKDGLLTAELNKVLDSFVAGRRSLFTIVGYPQNRGLWFALDEGVHACRNELVMRMDADDYSIPERAEEQLKAFKNHPDLGCVGSVVTEFVGDVSHPIAFVSLPEEHSDILRFGRKRCPYRHPALMYRKSAVEKAGGYQEMPFFEDYDLFMRLASSGCRFYNIQKTLVYMRTTPEFYARRGGIAYTRNMMRFENTCLKRGFITLGEWLATAIPHAVVCLMPNLMRTFVYTRFLRKPAGTDGETS